MPGEMFAVCPEQFDDSSRLFSDSLGPFVALQTVELKGDGVALVPFGPDIVEELEGVVPATMGPEQPQHTTSRNTYLTQLYDRNGTPSGVKTDEDAPAVDD